MLVRSFYGHLQHGRVVFHRRAAVLFPYQLFDAIQEPLPRAFTGSSKSWGESSSRSCYSAFALAGAGWNSWFIHVSRAFIFCGRPRKSFTSSAAGLVAPASSTVRR